MPLQFVLKQNTFQGKNSFEISIIWAEERQLGVLAENKKQVIQAIESIKQNYNKYQEGLEEFSRNFNGNGAKNTSKIVSEVLEKNK